MKVSIITVNYHVKEALFASINSIIASKPTSSYEIIVVDNDESPTIEKELQKKFPKVNYVKNKTNVGFGEANNRGVKIAKGDFLFILNPDTKVYKNTIDDLVQFLETKKDAVMVAPLLLGEDGKPYQQGAMELTPEKGLVVLSFLNKYFPNNPISRKYYLHEWDRKSVQEVAVAPGTAFMIKKALFESVGGFDNRFFLYFEEFDLCKRIKQQGGKIFIIPSAKVMHAWGTSTKQRKDINTIFAASRFAYFKKHFGFVRALIVTSFIGINTYSLVVAASIVLGLALTLYDIHEYMFFIGDYGWFYLSARDIFLKHTIPLVGIASSHPWLHQGALWTYMLAPVLSLFSYNPTSGAYLSGAFFILSILLLSKVGTRMFSRRVGAIAALLYATSPLIVITARSPYHTSPIPFFTIAYIYTLYRFIKGDSIYFPIIIFILALLYNLEIATFLLTIVFLLVVGYGFVTKKSWLKNVYTKKTLVYSLVAFLIPMTPMLLYDVGHGFPQTVKFIAWMGYKILSFFGLFHLHAESGSVSMQSVGLFIANGYKELIYPANSTIAFALAGSSFLYFFTQLFKKSKYQKTEVSYIILSLILSISILGIIATKTTSDAYLPVLFPVFICIIAVFLDKIYSINKISKFLTLALVLLIAVSNVSFLLTKNFYVSSQYRMSDKIKTVKQIISESGGRRYNLKGGPTSDYANFTANYEYLAWWLGTPPSPTSPEMTFYISETPTGIKYSKKIW